jgi:hypothetical protein
MLVRPKRAVSEKQSSQYSHTVDAMTVRTARGTSARKGEGMKAHVSSILLGVEDMERSKQFYVEGLGWEVEHDYRVSVFFKPDGGSLVGFYGRDGLAANVGVSPEGDGFSGLVLTYTTTGIFNVSRLRATR